MTDPIVEIESEIIGFDSGWGSKNHGCEDGPDFIKMDQLLLKLRRLNVSAKYRGTLGVKFLARHSDIKSKEDSLPLVVDGLRRLFNHTRHAIENKKIPIVIGGDHSSAIGTWSGVVNATDSHEKFGLIWIDAHLDAHTYESSKEGKWGGWWHGQPVTALLGFGHKDLINIGGKNVKLSPEHVTIIGPHSYEPSEMEFIKEHKIKLYTLDDVKEKGFEAVYKEALARASSGTKGFGLSIDIDAFHPDEAPAVGTPEEDGIKSEEVLPIIKSTALNPLFKALEITEFNPHNDKNGITEKLIEDIITNLFTKTDS